MEKPNARRLSLDEYLALEAVSADRLEYRDGFAVALAVPTGNHMRIASNLMISLGALAQARGCDISRGDAKVVTPKGDHVIPDLAITCDARDKSALDDEGEAVIRHPWLVVEILSPATAVDDTTYKADVYQSIPDLTHYVVIDSRRRAIRVYEKNDSGRLESGPVDRLVLPNLIDRGLSIDDIYRDTTVPRLHDIRLPGI